MQKHNHHEVYNTEECLHNNRPQSIFHVSSANHRLVIETAWVHFWRYQFQRHLVQVSAIRTSSPTYKRKKSFDSDNPFFPRQNVRITIYSHRSHTQFVNRIWPFADRLKRNDINSLFPTVKYTIQVG